MPNIETKRFFKRVLPRCANLKVFLGAGRDFVKRYLGFGRKKHELLLTGVYLGVFGPHVGIQVLHLLGQVAAAAALVSTNKYL